MTFAWPHLLWLLLIPAAWLVWDLVRTRRDGTGVIHPKIVVAEAGSSHVSLARPRPAASRARPWFVLGVALAIVALARPQWGRLEEPVFDQAREILIAIDLSRSMLTPDVKPTRLDRAKLLTQSLLEKLTGERVGLVIFSGTAFLQSPLSADYEILREFLPALGPDFLPEGGTNYGALIDTTVTAFSATAAADRFLIVLSDGEATEENWRDRLDDLKAKGVRVIALGVGTAAGAMIPDGAGGLVKDERGAVVMSKLESGTLRELADKTGGVYQDASSWIDLAALIQSTVEAGQKGKFTEKNTVRLVERFQWPLAVALWCLLVSAYYELPVRPKPREVKLRPLAAPESRSPTAAAAKSALLLCLLAASCALLVPRAFAQAAAPATAAPTSPLLAKIVGRLAVADERTARDWADFGHETVTWGSRLQSSQQPVPEGPVRDALAAAELGARLDPKTTDWPKLREELEALLKKPEPPKQDQKEDQQKQDQQQQKQQNQDKSDNSDKSENKDQQKSQEKPQDSSQPQEQEKGQPKPPPKPKEDQQSAFGDMKDRPPPPPQSTQKVGGVPEKKQAEPPADPALAVPTQKLDQLRNQDSPAELFKLMDADKDQTPRKKTKDW